MPYSELIKNFDGVRAYMREFYVYGFKSREEFTAKSARSYDDERRRIESWLGGYMGFRHTADGKNVFLSIDSRVSHHNPLYQAWKTKSFTDGDITLHFLLFDILSAPEIALPLNTIMAELDTRLLFFEEPRTFDVSTVRKKLKEYTEEGLLRAEKQGKTMLYRRTSAPLPACTDALDFFSEVAPCGVIGSFLLDKTDHRETCFSFKHHYITQALDSEILCTLFEAIRGRRAVTLETVNTRTGKVSLSGVVPLRIFISVQSGRQYLMAYVPRRKRIGSFRLDNILSVRLRAVCEAFSEYRAMLDRMQAHLWGVSTQAGAERMEHVDFTIRYGRGESYILQRLKREKRCGRVEELDARTCRFSAEVYDASELVPWIRTFLCRITEIHFSNPSLEARFRHDLENMYRIYGLNGEEEE